MIGPSGPKCEVKVSGLVEDSVKWIFSFYLWQNFNSVPVEVEGQWVQVGLYGCCPESWLKGCHLQTWCWAPWVRVLTSVSDVIKRRKEYFEVPCIPPACLPQWNLCCSLSPVCLYVSSGYSWITDGAGHILLRHELSGKKMSNAELNWLVLINQTVRDEHPCKKKFYQLVNRMGSGKPFLNEKT